MSLSDKQTLNGVEKRSVSAPSALFAEADRRAEQRRMSNFSEYVRDLMRRDVEGKLLQPAPHPQPEQVAA